MTKDKLDQAHVALEYLNAPHLDLRSIFGNYKVNEAGGKIGESGTLTSSDVFHELPECLENNLTGHFTAMTLHCDSQKVFFFYKIVLAIF